MRKRRPDPDLLFRYRGVLNLRRQVAEVRRLWPTLSATISGNTLTVSGEAQPTPLSDTYRIRVLYEFGQHPTAFVDQPALRPRYDSSQIPHVYPGPRPCLFLPRDWTGDEMIAATVIPWLLLWLTYYELWHATGEWQGGGEHPGPLASEFEPSTADQVQGDASVPDAII